MTEINGKSAVLLLTTDSYQASIFYSTTSTDYFFLSRTNVKLRIYVSFPRGRETIPGLARYYFRDRFPPMRPTPAQAVAPSPGAVIDFTHALSMGEGIFCVAKKIWVISD